MGLKIYQKASFFLQGKTAPILTILAVDAQSEEFLSIQPTFFDIIATGSFHSFGHVSEGRSLRGDSNQSSENAADSRPSGTAGFFSVRSGQIFDIVQSQMYKNHQKTSHSPG